MADVLIYADTIRSPELRHEVPVPVPDPLLYIERNGSRYVFASSLELPRLETVGTFDVVPLEEIGLDELIEKGVPRHELDHELTLRACKKLGISHVVAPGSFPLDQADYLRARGIQVTADPLLFEARRRVKTEVELEGIRKAQGAAAAAMDAIRARLRRGGSVTCEDLHGEANRVFSELGMIVPDIVIVSHGAQTAVGHEPGHGAIEAGEPIIADLYPRDPESGCFADMTRTFCVGDPPEELVRYHALCREALDLAYSVLRPGMTGQEAHRIVCEFFQGHGFPTQLTKKPGEVLDEGFDHSLGHGVGLEVHEQPGLGRLGTDPLVAGDVVAVEPGLYRQGFGGCRLEDLVLVTDDGVEVLIEYPYDLAP
jgi:Xaa-Pro aminopeptidase